MIVISVNRVNCFPCEVKPGRIFSLIIVSLGVLIVTKEAYLFSLFWIVMEKNCRAHGNDSTFVSNRTPQLYIRFLFTVWNSLKLCGLVGLIALVILREFQICHLCFDKCIQWLCNRDELKRNKIPPDQWLAGWKGEREGKHNWSVYQGSGGSTVCPSLPFLSHCLTIHTKCPGLFD